MVQEGLPDVLVVAESSGHVRHVLATQASSRACKSASRPAGKAGPLKSPQRSSEGTTLSAMHAGQPQAGPRPSPQDTVFWLPASRDEHWAA